MAPESRHNLAADLAVFVLGAGLQYATVYWAVPKLVATGLEPMAAWMLSSVPLIFVPLIACGWALLVAEKSLDHWRNRLQLERLSARDWLWGAGGLGCMMFGSGLAFWLCSEIGLDPNPPFARNVQAVTRERLWLVLLWLAYWPFNILGEEFIWRGVLLPRMLRYFGRSAWVIHAALWGAFHAAFGLGNILVLIPTLLVVPYVAQRRRNTWLAVMLHAGLSLPGFVSLALGLDPR